MANTDAPFGFVPYGKLLSADWYPVVASYATAIFVGDWVEITNTGLVCKIFDGETRMGVEIDATGAAGDELGAVLAILDHNGDPVKYLPASSAGDGVVAGYVSAGRRLGVRAYTDAPVTGIEVEIGRVVAVQTPLGENLLKNPGGETGKAATYQTDVLPIPHWNATEKFTFINYENCQGTCPRASEAVRIGGGKHVFAGGGGTLSKASQVVGMVPGVPIAANSAVATSRFHTSGG